MRGEHPTGRPTADRAARQNPRLSAAAACWAAHGCQVLPMCPDTCYRCTRLLKGRTRIASVPKESDQKQEYPDCRNVPYQRAQQRDSGCVEWQIGDATPKVELGTPLGKCVVAGCDMGCQNNRREQRERLEKVVQSAIESPGHATQWSHRLVSRASRPAITTLKARGMRRRHDMNEPERNAEHQERKLARHESTGVLAA